MILPLILGVVCGPSLVRCAAIVPDGEGGFEGVASTNFRIGSPDGVNNCNLQCPTTIDYHCGTNGVTYDNACALLNANCKDNNILLAYLERCSTDKVIPPSSCPQTWTCLGQYQPVCGTDGKTYDNNCYLVIANCRDTSIGLRFLGSCDNGGLKCKRYCSHIPTSRICGSDRIIYRNLCELRNAQCDKPNLIQVVCPTILQPKCADACPLTYAPKCGSDGKSYINKCHMDLITCRNPRITLAYDGICREVITEPAEIQCTQCTGNEPEDYVCGSDGTSYRSACAFNYVLCTQSCPATLKLDYSGKCKCDEDCALDQTDQVCGINNITYETVCDFRVASCNNPVIKLKNSGACTTL